MHNGIRKENRGESEHAEERGRLTGSVYRKKNRISDIEVHYKRRHIINFYRADAAFHKNKKTVNSLKWKSKCCSCKKYFAELFSGNMDESEMYRKKRGIRRAMDRNREDRNNFHSQV